MVSQLRLVDSPATYAIDASALVDLEDAHDVPSGVSRPPSSYSEREKQAIWRGLDTLASAGRLMLLKAVAEEAKRRVPDAVQRIRRFPRSRVRHTNRLRSLYQTAVETYRDWAPRTSLVEQGDPWLLAGGIEKGWVVISSELRRRDQKVKRRTRKETKLPDACDAHNVLCRTLRQVAQIEGWL